MKTEISLLTPAVEQPIPPGVKNIVGLIFGRLTVEQYVGVVNKRRTWLCRCSCPRGAFVYRTARDLRGHRMLSCGCLKKPAPARPPRHPLYMRWKNMMRRCYDPLETGYHNYGAIGVRVCRRWHSKENFFSDVGDPPSPDHTIDRFPNKFGDYDPSNFRWATPSEQNRNKRTNVWLELNGVRRVAVEWAKITGISAGLICARKRNGWSDERCLTQDPKLYFNRGRAHP